MIKTMTRSNLGREGFIWFDSQCLVGWMYVAFMMYVLFTVFFFLLRMGVLGYNCRIYSLLLGEVEAGTEAEPTGKCCLLAGYSSAFLCP